MEFNKNKLAEAINMTQICILREDCPAAKSLLGWKLESKHFDIP